MLPLPAKLNTNITLKRNFVQIATWSVYCGKKIVKTDDQEKLKIEKGHNYNYKRNNNQI